MIAGVFAIVAEMLHLGTSWRYGYFRDELYFIACSKHLAWGYVDQPPLVAVAALISRPTGYELTALRLLPVVAAALTVFLAVTMAKELGGGRFAQTLAGVATTLAPAYLLLGNTLTTTSFEPLTWTLLIYSCVRLTRSIARQDNSRAPQWWIAVACAGILGGYSKYSIALLAVALLVGLLLTPQRRILQTPWLALATLVALLALLPNIVWQANHGWPIVEVLQGDASHRPAFQNGVALESMNLWTNARAFALEQLLYLNPVSAPVWLTGLCAPLFVGRMRDLRFVTIAYAFVFLLAAALSAKGYYIVGIYASLFAFGSVAIERAVAALRYALLAALVVVGILVTPLSLPILPVDALVAYSQRLGLTGAGGTPARLVQPVFAEEFGWGRLAHDVAAAYFKLPLDVRRRTAIYADTYGDAGALDFFGPQYGLPLTISSQNNYYLWGTRGYDGLTMIAVGASRIDILRRYYRSVTLVATSTEPYRWVVEGPAPIYLCRNPVAPLSEIWPHLRWFGA